MQKIVIYRGVGEVTLSKSRRSTRITLSVKPDGRVRLSFPLWVTQRRALKFLEEKTEWIAAARRKMVEKYPDLTSTAHSDGDGCTGADGSADTKAAELKAVRAAVEALRTEAKAKLPPMVERLAAEHGFRHGAVRVKATRSRWGSCSARNDINLSLALAALPEHLARYIVLHELCHTVHKNHSVRFHALLDHVTEGRSKALNAELRQHRPDTAIARWTREFRS